MIEFIIVDEVHAILCIIYSMLINITIISIIITIYLYVRIK